MSARQIARAASLAVPFMPNSEMAVILRGMRGEESEFFESKLLELEKVIHGIPTTYGQDGMGDKAVAHLHYFRGGANWYITEKDMEGDGTIQAFGLVDLGTGPELGYISIRELVAAGVELDLHWQPTSLGEIKRNLQQ